MLYSVYYETPSEVDAQTYIQILMPAAREMRLWGILIDPQYTANPQNAGTWVMDRISAIHASGSAYTARVLMDAGVASVQTSTTQVVNPTGTPTQTETQPVGLAVGIWNLLWRMNITSGINQGFSLRRNTAASGALVCGLTMVWAEAWD